MRANHSKSKSPTKKPAEQVVKDIHRATRRHFSAEDKIRIVLDGLRGDDSIAELCRKEGPMIFGPRACITSGRRSSWRPASAAWRAIRRALPRVTKSRICAVNRAL